MSDLTNPTPELSPIKRALFEIRTLRARLEELESAQRPHGQCEAIAIVGAGLRFPGGVVDETSFWELLAQGKDAITEIPLDRWNWRAYFDMDPDAPGAMYTRHGGFLDGIDRFDAAFFGISPREAVAMDPQHRLALEVGWEALENAGYSPATLQESSTGIFLGIANNDYGRSALGDMERIDAYTGSGNSPAMVTGRLSYVLGVHGPSLAIDTSCSSSLVAVHVACASIRADECSVALAGGVNLILSPEPNVALSKARMMARDGHCKTFDEAADGYVRSEGCGIVVLKKLSDAISDGDRILAVIRGSAVNHDGRSGGLTAPNGPAQAAVMRKALDAADINAGEIGYVETHGTGTALGDPIEVETLASVMGVGRAIGDPVAIGSVKTNIGHAEGASGVAGLLKAVLALEHGEIPPSLHLNRKSSHIDWNRLPVIVPTEVSKWKPLNGHRYAGVSSFGFSGTNAHAVLEEAPKREIAPNPFERPKHVLTISARTQTALDTLCAKYVDALRGCPADELADLCFTANTGRVHFDHRVAVVGETAEQMAAELEHRGDAASSSRIFTGNVETDEGERTGFLFTGQGSQYGGMGRELYEGSPVFRAGIERCAVAWKRETGESLTEVLYPAEGAAARMEQARYAQPALFAFEYALAEMWRSWGVEPSVLLGHSLGEYVAAVVAGVFSVEDGLKLVCARARLMDTLKQPGAMRTIGANAERVRAEIAGLEEEVAVAVINGPESVVLSGLAETVERVAGKLEAEGIRTRALQVTHGFHSPLLEPILEEFEATARQVKYHAPRIRTISNLTGETARAEEIATPRYWREHMRGTVLFHPGLQAALATGCRTFLEIGPQPHLLSLGKSVHGDANLSWLPSVRRGRNAWLDILPAIKALYEMGAEIDWRAFHGKSGRPIALPTYPFERQHFWFPKKSATDSQPSHERFTQGHPLLGSRLHSPLAAVQFESRIDPDHPAYLSDHSIAGHCVVPAAAYLEMALSAAETVDREPASVRSAVFLQPCIFDKPQILQCVLRGDRAVRTFEIYSRPETSEETDWILHATGETVGESGKNSLEQTPPADLDEVGKRCTNESDASAFYRVFDENNVDFGPDFRPVTRVFRGHGEALVQLEISPDVKSASDKYRIHPIALDACFQAVVALLPTSGEGSGTVYLPAALDSLHIVGDPKDLVAAHAQIRDAGRVRNKEALTADLRGFDLSGNVVLYASGLMLRPFKSVESDTSQSGSISRSFYEIEWVPVETGETQKLDIAGTCVLAGEGEIIAGLSAAFKTSNVPCQTISADDRATNGEQRYDELLRAASKKQFAPIGDVFYIAPNAVEDVFHLSPDRLMELEAETLGECMELAQALLRMDAEVTPRLWIVTRGAQGPALSNVPHSTLWGFGRSVAAEHPEMRVARIDVDPSRETSTEDLLRCMSLAGKEDELALRDGEIYAPRLRPKVPDELKAKRISQADDGEEPNVRLELVNAGTLEGIENVPADRPEPKPGEVEIQVAAAGLNFRDVLNALGMYKGKSGPLGGECAGTVVRVGSGVESLRPGDEVVAVGPGSFSRFMTAPANMIWPKPANLSFEAAVTIPVAFLTAWYGLNTIASIQPGESVLIHAGAGGVGLAAIQIAQNAGATVFATAGSPEKRAYLSSIGVPYVMDSRSLDFASEISRITGGRGVDVVLNSLAGPFIDAGMKLLAPNGRFVELGVADIRSDESVAALRSDIMYHPFNLAPALEVGDRTIREILAAIFEQLRTGVLKPLPRSIFRMENARDAFRYMAQARHIGRVVLCPSATPDRVGIRSDGAYLVTGGMSGVGLKVSEWLGQCGAAQVIVLGRRPANEEAIKVFNAMQTAGIAVSVCQGDVTREVDVQAALNCAKDFPLRGIFHCAGILDDGVLLQQDWNRFRSVLSPKLAGTCNLHRFTADSPLDHFVLFSSVASVFGSPGQTNYAAANAFLDSMAQYRHARELPALNINWGAWSETGSAVRHRVVESGSKTGLIGIPTVDGLHALDTLLADSQAQVMFSPIDWRAYFAGAGLKLSKPLLNDLQLNETRSNKSRMHLQVHAPADSSQKKNPSWLPQLEEIASTRRRDLLVRLLTERAQDILGLSRAQEIDLNQPLQELGLDSLLSIELRNSLGLSLNRSLPATLLFNYPTLKALAGFILQDVLTEEKSDMSPQVRKDPVLLEPANLVDDIEALSDEEIDRLLSARTTGRIQ